MSGWSVVRWTGVLGLAAVVAQLVGFVIAFAAGQAPAFDDAAKVLAFAKNGHFVLITALLLFSIGFALFIGFSAGLRAVAVMAAPDHEWLATATLASGVVIILLAFVGLGLGLAATATAVSSHADATLVRS